MSYYENERYDVFIAYYGNRETGSERQAEELYHRINNIHIHPNKRIRAYFHPQTNPFGRFEDTPMIVARTPMFLLVVDKDIPRNPDGQLLRHRSDRTLSNLFEEVRSFQDSAMYKEPGGDQAAKVFITDNMDFKAAERLHPIFSGRTALSSYDQAVQWITHFYTKTYPDRLFKKYEFLAREKREEFLQGAWIAEAEDAWKTLRNERIGRSLLIYYVYKASRGDESARNRLWALEREFSGFRNLEPKTRTILDKLRYK